MISYVIISISIGVLLALLPWIPWRRIALHWVGDDPDRCIVYMKSGHHVKKYYGRVDLKVTTAREYQYDKDHKWSRVVLPKDYCMDFIEGYLMIGVKDGFIDAIPVLGQGGVFGQDDFEMYADARDSIGLKNSIQSVKSAGLNILFVVIAAVVGAGLMYVFQNYILKR